jgi:hypothetical protein
MPFPGSGNDPALEAAGHSAQAERSGKSANRQVPLQIVLTRDECEMISSESEQGVRQAQVDFAEGATGSAHTGSDLKKRIDQLPELLINQQLAMLFDQEYLDDVGNPKVFAKKLLDVALADGDINYLETADTEHAVVDIEFSLSPASGLRQFSRLAEVEPFDRVFVHIISSADYHNLMVRWQHRDTGEILYFSPLDLTADQRVYLSLSPKRGWLPGGYLVSLYDLNNSQKLVSSNEYQIDSVLNVGDQQPQADKDVIEDLLSNGMAVPKAH